jgi:tungstate transport system permease protein
MRFAILSTLLSLIPALPVGFALSAGSWKGRRTLVALLNALTALPTVVIGLLVYSLISRSGPLGDLDLMYAPGGVILGQAFLAFPVVASMTCAALAGLDPRFRETVHTLGAGRWLTLVATFREAKGVLAAAVVTAFGRVTGEVGVSMMLGGNIRHVTRTMTTAIALDASKGEFERAISLGLVLLIIAVAVNIAVHALSRHET